MEFNVFRTSPIQNKFIYKKLKYINNLIRKIDYIGGSI